MDQNESFGAVMNSEIERKYDVEISAVLPEAFQDIEVTDDTTTNLTAEYYDTSCRKLAQNKVALRRREGGTDEGWHIKVRADSSVSEFHWPFGESIPQGAADFLLKHFSIEADELKAMAKIETTRRELTLYEKTGEQKCGAYLVDDNVKATDFVAGAQRTWREWECELIAGDEKLLDRVERTLFLAGAIRSIHSSKIARATGVDPKK